MAMSMLQLLSWPQHGNVHQYFYDAPPTVRMRSVGCDPASRRMRGGQNWLSLIHISEPTRRS
eukprot:1678888-Prymnesium_polylepis.1